MVWSEALKDISILLAAWSVIYGIGAWRREFIGKRKIQLAEDVLALFYEAKDVIFWIRSPFGFEGETDEVKKRDDEQDAEFQARKSASVVFVRYNQNKELFSKIHALRYRFIAQIGKQSVEPFEDLNKIMKDIILSARQLARLWPGRNLRTEKDKDRNRERIRKAEAIFWEGSTDPDPINPRLEEVITKMEKICRPIIEDSNSLYH